VSEVEVTIRRASEDDLEGLLRVAAASLGWVDGEPHEALFRWKHMESPFGPSPLWLAECNGEIAGYRAFMRWELRDQWGSPVTAVRAVDTATHPDFQRRGVFSRLTTHGVEEMLAEGINVVFNTPNDQSRPGYLKMGWRDIGRLPVAFRATQPLAVVRMFRARTPAEKWSEPTEVGVGANEVTTCAGMSTLLASRPQPVGWSTAMSGKWLQWRFGLEPLHYRAWVPQSADDGVVFFRLRRRGGATECSVGLVLAPESNPDVERQLLDGLAKAVDADYLLRMGPPDPRGGFLPAPRGGPRLTAREITATPDCDIKRWAFSLADIELF